MIEHFIERIKKGFVIDVLHCPEKIQTAVLFFFIIVISLQLQLQSWGFADFLK